MIKLELERQDAIRLRNIARRYANSTGSEYIATENLNSFDEYLLWRYILVKLNGLIYPFDPEVARCSLCDMPIISIVMHRKEYHNDHV